MTEVLIEGVWCKLPFELVHPMEAATLGAVCVKHPALGEIWVVPRSFPIRQA